MKRNDIAALSDKTVAELTSQLQELKQQLAQAKLQLKVGKLEDTRTPSKLRDDIARVKTVLRQVELSAKQPNEDKENHKEPKKKEEKNA